MNIKEDVHNHYYEFSVIKSTEGCAALQCRSGEGRHREVVSCVGHGGMVQLASE